MQSLKDLVKTASSKSVIWFQHPVYRTGSSWNKQATEKCPVWLLRFPARNRDSMPNRWMKIITQKQMNFDVRHKSHCFQDHHQLDPAEDEKSLTSYLWISLTVSASFFLFFFNAALWWVLQQHMIFRYQFSADSHRNRCWVQRMAALRQFLPSLPSTHLYLGWWSVPGI